MKVPMSRLLLSSDKTYIHTDRHDRNYIPLCIAGGQKFGNNGMFFKAKYTRIYGTNKNAGYALSEHTRSPVIVQYCVFVHAFIHSAMM